MSAPAIKIPKNLKVKPAERGTYEVFIKRVKVGDIKQKEGRDPKTFFEFTPARPMMPAVFKTRTMKELRTELVRRISRDLYMRVMDMEENRDG